MAIDSGYWGNGKALDSGYWESDKDTNVLTNADRIRAMSDEELAEFLSKADFYCKGNCKKCLRGTACIPMLQWLKQPVGDE